MDKALNNFYIKTLLRILKENKVYEFFRKEIALRKQKNTFASAKVFSFY